MLFKSLAQYRLRLLFRGTFLLLAIATVALALSVLQQEKQVSYNNYQSGFKKTQQQIAATLRNPIGQLALINPPTEKKSSGLHPLLLPFGALDFDNKKRAQQQMTMSGCLVQYGSNGSLCVGVSNNAWMGGYIYAAGNFESPTLVSHRHGDLDFHRSHRMRVSVTMRGQSYRWIAPFELDTVIKNQELRGKFTGFWERDVNNPNARPAKEFSSWVWQEAACNQAELDEAGDDCKKNTFFSLRLPIAVLQEALFEKKRPVWPPEDLDQIQVQLSILPPDSDDALFDSNREPSSLPFSLNELQSTLLPGESLRIRKSGSQSDMIKLDGASDNSEESWNILTRLIRRLPVSEFDQPLINTDQITTALGKYDVILQGDVRSVSKSLSVVATRASWYVGGMLVALSLAWFMIEVGIIRRITLLTTRASSLSKTVKGASGIAQFDISDLRRDDELGILASCLHDLLRRVKEDVEREAIRAEQEKEMWHAVGHEIMSPLQSLMVLHGNESDASHRYINRMQQAIQILYGSASPSEAFQSSVLQVAEIDITTFLRHVASNAPLVGIADIVFYGPLESIMVRADEYSLEDVVTHILRNANRYRIAATPIILDLQASETSVSISISNQGQKIPPELIDKIFEYGVSDQPDSGANGNRGQGLFVAKTYMAKMGGTVTVENKVDGVCFSLTLQRGTS